MFPVLRNQYGVAPSPSSSYRTSIERFRVSSRKTTQLLYRVCRGITEDPTMYVSRLRGPAAVAVSSLPRRAAATRAAFFSTTARQLKEDVAAPSPPPAGTTSTTANTQTTPQTTEGPAPTAVAQAPNRAGIWSRSQRPRAEAMTGPRFEQTDFELQVRF